MDFSEKKNNEFIYQSSLYDSQSDYSGANKNNLVNLDYSKNTGIFDEDSDSFLSSIGSLSFFEKFNNTGLTFSDIYDDIKTSDSLVEDDAYVSKKKFWK
jgi:hypothetical protein